MNLNNKHKQHAYNKRINQIASELAYHLEQIKLIENKLKSL